MRAEVGSEGKPRTRDRERTRAAIHSAALTLFPERGFADTSVRDIASLARVDPAQVIRIFGSKEKLFISVMVQPGIDPFAGPRESLGRTIVTQILRADERTRSTYVTLNRASSSELVAQTLRELHEEAVLEPLLKATHGDDAELRARLASSAVLGLLHQLWIIGDKHIEAAELESVVDLYGPLIQNLIDR